MGDEHSEIGTIPMPPTRAPAVRPETLRTLEELAADRLIDAASIPGLREIARRYAVAVPPTLAALIDRSDPHDPIARQIVPSAAEAFDHPDERADPIGDEAHSPVEGVVHRYPDRALLKLVHTCPLYCRFCFRREVVGPGGSSLLGEAKLDAALAYLRSQPGLREVIMTGGDPLTLSARRVREVTERLAAIPHLETLRWHTRVPIATPELVDGEMIAALLAGGNLVTVWMAIHTNHVAELGEAARAAITRLAGAGIPLLGQTVLLKGVNDDAEVLAELFRELVRLRVRPYYLHHPDLARGTSHFRLSLAEGQAIYARLRGRLGGPAIPTYVLDIPGGHGKVAVAASALAAATETEDRDGSRVIVVAPNGSRHLYPPDRTGK